MSKKKGLKVKVVGCGGIGSWLVDPLCTMLNYSAVPSIEVSLIDGDSYEERNRERQNFTEIGPKATITAARLREKFPRLMFWDHPVYLTDANIISLIRENDVVALCVDNHKTRKLVSDRACELDDVTIISGGNELTDGNVFTHVRRDGKNLTLPLANKYQPNILKPSDKNPGDDKEHGCQVMAAAEPQLIATNFGAAYVMLCEIYKLVANEPKHQERLGKTSEVNFDILTGNAKSQLRQ
jgi:molybdopterin/thiamine biosynthesis adenylyltransferase